jgi:PAS domain-containing protein
MLSLQSFYASPSFQQSSLGSQLRNLVEEFRAQARKEGIPLRSPPDSSAWQKIDSLPLPMRQAMLNGFANFYGIYSAAVEEEIGFQESRKVLWRMIARMKLLCCSDLFNAIDDHDVIEVYDSSLIQIFRNLRFLELCTYSMEEVLAHEWTQLFRRPASVDAEILRVSREILESRHLSTFKAPFPAYALEETFSDERARFWIEHGVISPLFDSEHRVVAFVSTLKATPIPAPRSEIAGEA